MRFLHLFAAFSAALMLLTVQPAGADGTGNRPCGLMTDLVAHPDFTSCGQEVEIFSRHPRLSWVCGSGTPFSGKKNLQRKYRILVAESEESLSGERNLLWDSGIVKDDRSSAVLYGGPALASGKTYWWKVKVWMSRTGESGWSAPQRFHTAARLEEYATPAYPLQKTPEYPVSLVREDGLLKADFGKAAFGYLEAELSSAAGGDTVVFHLGECLRDGRILRNPTTTVRYQRHEVVLEKGMHTYRIEVTPDRRNTGPAAIKMPAYIGEVMPFRYCEIEGYDTSLTAGQLVRQSVHYPFQLSSDDGFPEDYRGYFSCSDSLLTDIWDLCLYSVKATSFTGIYIDGDRERIPYEADALINQLCHYAADREYTMARRSIEYLLEHPTWPTEWILQSVMMAWNDYLFTGDDRLITAQYDLLKAHCLEALKEENGLISTRTGRQTPGFLASIHRTEAIRDIVDWPQKVPEVDGVKGGSDGFVFEDFNAVVNAYYYRALCDMGRIASALGRKADAEHYAAESARVKNAFLDAFYDPEEGRVHDGIDTDHSALHSNVFAIAFGLVPEKDLARVTEYVVSKGMSCGVYVSQFLLEALYEAGAGEAAFNLLTSRSVPSWYNMLKVGATISLEAWDDTFKPNQDWNHIWGAAPGNIIPFRLMGVWPLEPGCARVRIAPQPGALKSALLAVPTVKGRICVSLQPEEMRVTLPDGVTAEVVVPMLDGTRRCCQAGSGTTLFRR